MAERVIISDTEGVEGQGGRGQCAHYLDSHGTCNGAIESTFTHAQHSLEEAHTSRPVYRP